ncbi:hypothetical protein A2872_04325 [Candidatus Gottesmanbacteria bacterium RIFCSPHIGHO2_01_FULL_42_12]|uniref:Peptidase S11 D-alanyl-D-alanine carboxypeptidase A N-terminal domain-containing protein n=1 Tax=Candidatus Gottesmanbacteria bacterium RIFCSPHIGHO2_01_FULL_42_12 TaxID=1798377 RepID=A0A1F5Z1V2_9BACT|nr:MAG: hypothetical protein A2872_04325 [Candidatus Gottesmanbacteria bacterium RIFCSPHIGHO2_01_FULL_42_12]
MKKKGKKQKQKVSTKLNLAQIVGIIFAALFLFLLPGQSYYQTLILNYYPPKIRSSRFDDFTPSPYPVKFTNAVPPIITASAAAVIDLDSGVPLYQKSTTLRLKPASITKLMTALVALDYYQPDDIITVSKLVTISGDSKMGLKLGDQLSVRSLLYGLLLPSGNDAAYVIADNIPGGYEQFITSMNKRAEKLHMYHTHFSNPTGRDEDDHYSTVYDLIILTRAALQNQQVAEVVKTNWTTVLDVFGTKSFPLKNVNELLTTYTGIYGVKTGYTELAGQCLVATAKRGNRKILTVVLNSKDRFRESTELLNFGFDNFRLKEQTELR